jgi:fluoride exporter
MMAGVPWAHLGAVAAGATIGAWLRWLAGLWLNGKWAGFPLGTLLVNCVGGLLIGGLLLWFERVPHEMLRLLLITGLLGGLTTFSSYSAESLILLQRGHWALAIGHTLAHVLGSLLCAALGYQIARYLLD